MKTKITAVALIAVTAGVFAYTRTHNTPIPSDLRDAVADNGEFNTSIPVFPKDRGNIPEPKAEKADAGVSKGRGADYRAAVLDAINAAQDLGEATGKIDGGKRGAHGKKLQYSYSEKVVNAQGLTDLKEKLDELKDRVSGLSFYCEIEFNSLLYKAQDLGYSAGRIDALAKYTMFSGADLDGNAKLMMRRLDVQKEAHKKFIAKCIE